MSKLRVITERNPNATYDKPDLRGILDEHLKNSFPVPVLHIKNLSIKSTHLQLIEHFNFSLEHAENKMVTVKPRHQHERFKEFTMVLFLLGHSMSENPETTFFLTMDHLLHRQILSDDKIRKLESEQKTEIKKWHDDHRNFVSSTAQELIRQSGISLHESKNNLYTSDELRQILLQSESASIVHLHRKAG